MAYSMPNKHLKRLNSKNYDEMILVIASYPFYCGKFKNFKIHQHTN